VGHLPVFPAGVAHAFRDIPWILTRFSWADEGGPSDRVPGNVETQKATLASGPIPVVSASNAETVMM
jgi:hypothetical protein